MRWKTKSVLQNAISMLPNRLSLEAYYTVQRRFGGLRNVDPTCRLVAGIETCKRILAQGESLEGKTFFELGTGRLPLVPIAYWLMGAKRTISVDLNRYLKPVLCREALLNFFRYKEQVTTLFGGLADLDRLSALQRLAIDSPSDVEKLMRLCCIEYKAPCDAAETGLPSGSIDFHTSYTVLEHIPKSTLGEIFDEGGRLVKKDGLFVHRVDYSDHFSHSDSSISAINFLQFSELKWDMLAGNRYMYMNRLRHDDFLDLFRQWGHSVLMAEPDVDREIVLTLKDPGFSLDDRFRDKSEEVLCTTGSWFVSRKSSV